MFNRGGSEGKTGPDTEKTSAKVQKIPGETKLGDNEQFTLNNENSTQKLAVNWSGIAFSSFVLPETHQPDWAVFNGKLS
ncbi:hypothetical protein [Larkinella rosea]|uniref:hypothetical protein n=1 Tax=Larkinella rosea TaxID=2025312 RepID=UPI000F5DA578|nr:hypothetical protein [Larkinella rosea]